MRDIRLSEGFLGSDVAPPRRVLMVYESPEDRAVLDRAIDIAGELRSRLTVAIRIHVPGSWAWLGPWSVLQLREDAITEAQLCAAEVAAAVPQDMSVTVQCFFPEKESRLARAVRQEEFDLIVRGPGRGRIAPLHRRWGPLARVTRSAACCLVGVDELGGLWSRPAAQQR